MKDFREKITCSKRNSNWSELYSFGHHSIGTIWSKKGWEYWRQKVKKIKRKEKNVKLIRH